MVIDAHAHLDRNPRDLDRMVNSGVIKQAWLMDTSVYSQGKRAEPEQMLRVAREYEGFFIPFGFLDFRKPPDIVDKLKDEGFIGLKAIKPPKPYDDPSYFPYYEKAASLGMPILFHTGIIAKRSRKETGPGGEGLSYGPTNMRPSMLDGIAACFPELKLIGGHIGWPWCEETRESLYYYPNIYHDISGFVDFPWLINNLDGRCREGGYFTDRVLFAVDGAYGSKEGHDYILEKTRFWKLFFKYVGRDFRWGEESEKIFRLNAETIIGARGPA